MYDRENLLRPWTACDARMASAVADLKAICTDLKSSGARRFPVKRLIKAHLDPAFGAISANFVPDSANAILEAFGKEGLSGWSQKLVELDIAISCFSLRVAHPRFLRSVDALRSAIVYLRATTPHRPSIETEKGLRGAVRRRPVAGRATTTLDYPYCELCYRLVEAVANDLQSKTPAAQQPKNQTYRASARYCIHHLPSRGPDYDRDFRRKVRFQEVLGAVFAEIAIEETFRRRFSGLAADDALGLPRAAIGGRQSHDPSFDLRLFSDYVSNIRRYAYFVAQESSLETKVKIAEGRTAGLSFAAISKQLGLTLQTVREHAENCRGGFDFRRHSRLLYWWPDRYRIAADALRISKSQE